MVNHSSQGEREKVDYTRRTGIDRREQSDPPDGEQRMNVDRRFTLHHHFQLVEVLEKIPLFRGLSTHEFKEILRICTRRNFLLNEVIFHAGEESYEIFILLQGTLKVTFKNGKEISRIVPIGIAGEMGVFNGELRSANIVAASNCIVLSIHKMELLKLFRHDSDLGVRMLLNVIRDLSNKLRNDNEIIQDLKQLCPPGVSTGVILGENKPQSPG